jgi:CRISPR-associated endonuclease/helicase Cas3
MRAPKQNPEAIKYLELEKCIAKTVKLADGSVKKGVNVTTHCEIVGYVACELIKRQPEWLRSALYPAGSELVAAAHDLGKISPHFQEKIYGATGETLGVGKADLDTELGGHAAISQACLENAPEFIPQILGRHHGVTPASVEANCSEIYGGEEWQIQRMALLKILKENFNTDFPIIEEYQANVITGLTCVADWIGSGSLFDTIFPDGTINSTPWETKITDALDNAGFIRFIICTGLSFYDVFGFEPREVQRKLIEAANQPGVYILEAPMGIGKTEAALYAAYKILESNRATGIYFALPTQITSDKIYDRMNTFLEHVLGADCQFRSLLLHSSAWLRDTELGEEGMPGKEWFNSSKRGLLAPFAVGTIDQALMGVMNIKHGFVRTFGLAGKVVILDEVHSYDSYTGTIMSKLVQALKEIHCTVIILSATLTKSKSADLLGANKEETGYPLISGMSKNGNLTVHQVNTTENAEVVVSIRHNEKDAIEETIRRADQGEQVLWIENTVAESQVIFKYLAARCRSNGLNIECGLLHSRFIRNDRMHNENKWVNVFGKNGHALRIQCGRILVGTQVLEQSLDIDADFLVTRICPTDMLFQRIGRLWRHRETDSLRSKNALREALILTPILSDCAEKSSAWGKSGNVYAPYVLYRTLEEWLKKKTIQLPDDIRFVLEATYKERNETGYLAQCKMELEKKRNKLEGLARIGISTGGKTLPESKATTRYSETESCEVLLIKNKTSDANGSSVTLLNGDKLYINKNAKKNGLQSWRKLAAVLQKNVVLTPEYLAPQTPANQMSWLKEFVYIGNYEESPFRVAIVNDNGNLSALDSNAASSNYELSYDNEIGYRAKKKDKTDTSEYSW